jgi:hypothetical protein
MRTILNCFHLIFKIKVFVGIGNSSPIVFIFTHTVLYY